MQNDYGHSIAYQQYQMNYNQHPQQQYSPISPVQSMYDSFESPPASSLVQRTRTQGPARRVSPEALIPLDAPTQPRRYLTPSATSRKEVPAFFTKRPSTSSYSRGSEEEEDELPEEPLPSNATDQEKIDYKRRQNTIAARRSRKRKALERAALEEQVEGLKREAEMWKTRAMLMRQMLVQHGILCPNFEDNLKE